MIASCSHDGCDSAGGFYPRIRVWAGAVLDEDGRIVRRLGEPFVLVVPVAVCRNHGLGDEWLGDEQRAFLAGHLARDTEIVWETAELDPVAIDSDENPFAKVPKR